MRRDLVSDLIFGRTKWPMAGFYLYHEYYVMEHFKTDVKEFRFELLFSSLLHRRDRFLYFKDRIDEIKDVVGTVSR